MKPTTFPLSSLGRLSLIAVSCAVLSACAIKPEPLGIAEQKLQLSIDREMARKDVETLSQPLTLDQAIARAIKYNLDHRVRMMEQSVAIGQLDLSRFDMWPQAMASAGYTTRNKPLITEATNSVTGAPSLSEPFISSAQSYWNLSLGLSWNLLDFGAGYFNAKQNANRVLIAGERRRRAMHLLMVDVQNAYWRAASAQALKQDIVRTVGLAEEALKNSSKAEQSDIRQPIDAVRYQKNILENLRNIDIIQSELGSAQIELANLINLPPSTEIKFATPAFTATKTAVTALPIEVLEEVALINNADLRETFYNVRIAASETRKAMLRLLPGINLNWGPNYTTNSYIINQAWNAGAVSIGWNMLNALMMPAIKSQGEAQEALSVQRRMAMQMTVLGQVHLARLQYENAARVLERSSALASADRKIEKFTVDGAASGTQSQAEMVAAQTVSIISEMRRYQAIAQLYAANGRLQASLGFEPNLSDIQNTSLEDLTSQVATAMSQWQTGEKVKKEAEAIERSAESAPASLPAVTGSAGVASMASVAGVSAEAATRSQPELSSEPQREPVQPVQSVQSWKVPTVSVEQFEYKPLSWNNARPVTEN
jgi:outer membrane protein TolC